MEYREGSAGHYKLRDQVTWPTPKVQDTKHATASPSEVKRDNPCLAAKVHMAQWATPRSEMSAGSKNVQYTPGKKPTIDGRPITTSLTDQVKHSAQSVESHPANIPAVSFGPTNSGESVNEPTGPPAPATPNTDGNLPELWPTPRTCAGKRSSGAPRTEFYRKMDWPTAQTGGIYTGNHDIDKVKKLVGDKLGQAMTVAGKLNPRWVETLMGVPPHWTDVNASPETVSMNFAVWETLQFLLYQRLLGQR